MAFTEIFLLVILSCITTAKGGKSNGGGKRQVGSVCGQPPDDCGAMKCPCQLCADGFNTYGCCGDCYINEDKKCGSYKPESTCPTATCGGFDNCLTFNDGCNACTCNPGSDLMGCTEIACTGNLPEPYCTQCIDGYCPDTNGECQSEVSCFANPCTHNNGGCSRDEICEANYCGGCNTVCTSPPVCATGGCSGEICAAGSISSGSICVYLCEYSCLQYQTCDVGDTGECGWQINDGQEDEYQQCLDECKPVAVESAPVAVDTNNNFNSFYNNLKSNPVMKIIGSVGIILFILINNVFICYWCIKKADNKPKIEFTKV